MRIYNGCNNVALSPLISDMVPLEAMNYYHWIIWVVDIFMYIVKYVTFRLFFNDKFVAETGGIIICLNCETPIINM